MVLVYGCEQPMDDAISSDQQSAVSQNLEAEALKKQSLLQPLAQRCTVCCEKIRVLEFVQGPRCTIETRVDTVDGYAPGSWKFIKSLGASKLTHTLFHPSIYRAVQSLGMIVMALIVWHRFWVWVRTGKLQPRIVRLITE
ncbi:hypothetical protein MP228_011918 [Amoeboaphelidium protococcarum]|nr:hypothetical protein MP228_011918 [Amoeboaphelidium protococcarum]